MTELQWQVHRRPQPLLLWLTAGYGLLFFITSLILIPYLVQDNSWPWQVCGAVIGLFLAAMLFSSVWAGAVCSVNNDGICIYGFGGKPNLSFKLQDVLGWKLIQEGPLQGIGIEIEIEQIQLLHRKGISIRKMRSYQQQLGCSMVLEFLNAEDCQVLQGLSQGLNSSTETA